MSSKLTKSEKTKSKFTQLNINHVYKGNTSETHHKPAVRQYGMQVVGKLQGTRRLPPPAWVPSLKAETGGLDPRVSLVPAGGSGWGAPYSGISANDTEPAEANNELSSTLDNVANATTYSSMNGALREAIGTSFEPAFARQNMAYAATVTTESSLGTKKSGETMASAVAKIKGDTITTGEGKPVPVSGATSEVPANSHRSQSTAASGGLAANRPFFQRPTPVVTATTTTPSRTSVDSVTVSGVPAGAKGTCTKATDWASIPNGEEPNYDEKLLFSDEEDIRGEPQDAVVSTPSTSGRQPVQKDTSQSVTSSVTALSGTSTWATTRSGSSLADHSGIVTDTRLFPNVPVDAWQAPDPTTLVESGHCSSLPGHLAFAATPSSITGTSMSHETGGCVPLDGPYLSSTSSVHVQSPYKDPYFPQAISSRLMETSISSRIPETGLITGDSEVELQNFQRQARTKEFKSAVERAQHARNARQKPDAFLADQSGHQVLHPCGINVSDPSIGLKYCQPVSVPLQSTANMVPRDAVSNVGPLINNSITTPHLLLSAYQQAAAAAMALSGGNSAPPRFPFSHLVAPTTGSSTSATPCAGVNSQWSGHLNPNITSGASQPSLLNSRAQNSLLDTFSVATGSASNISQMSTPASHPPAILLNPEFFVERFWEILNQQQTSRPSQQPTDQSNKTILEGNSELPQPPAATASEDLLEGSQQHYNSKCNGNLILGDYGFRADHFASACIEDSSPQTETSLKATRFVTPSPDTEPLSTTVPDAATVRTATQYDSDKSSSKLSKRVPGLMDVKVPKSTACNLAHLWDQDDYLAPGPRTVGSRGRGRQPITDRGRGSAGKRRGTFRSAAVDPKPSESGAAVHLSQTPDAAPGDYFPDSQDGDEEVKQQVSTMDEKVDQVHTDGSESGGGNEDEADDSGNVIETTKGATATARRGSNKKRAGDQPGDARMVDGSRRFRGRGDSQYYPHDSGYNYYDNYGNGGRGSHRTVSRGSSSYFTTHRSFNSRDTAGSYSTRYIRQLGGGSFSSRDYRQHTPASADQNTAKSGLPSQGYKDGRCPRGELLLGKQGELMDQSKRAFTSQRKQARGNGTPGPTDYHFSDSEEPQYHRRNREPATLPPRNRSHEGPRCDLSKNSDHRRTPIGDADESAKSGPLAAQTPKESRSATKDTHLLDYGDADIPTVRVPASDTRLANTYRQQYPFSRSGGYRSSAYHRRGGKTAPNGHRSTGRTNPQQPSKQTGTSGSFPSARRYRELRDRHRDDGRDGDGGGAAAGGGSNRSGTGSGGASGAGGTGGGGTGKGGGHHTVPSGGGVSGSRDDSGPTPAVDQRHSLDLCGDEEEGDDVVGNSNENNAQLHLKQATYVPDTERLVTVNHSVRLSNHSTSEGGGHHRVFRQQQRHRFQTSEGTDSYIHAVYAPQRRVHAHRAQNIPPLMSIKPTGPFACNPQHFDAVLDLGCSRPSKTEANLAAGSPQVDGASVKSEASSLGREHTDQEIATEGNCRNAADDCDDDRASFLSDGFTEVVSKASKRLARLRLQQEAAVAAAAAIATALPTTSKFGGGRDAQKQASARLSSQNSARFTGSQRQQERSSGLAKATNAARTSKKKSASASASTAAKYAPQRDSKLANIKATFMGPPLSSLVSDAAANSLTDRGGVSEQTSSAAAVGDVGYTTWPGHSDHHPPAVTAAVPQEPRTWSKVVGTKSSSAGSSTISSDQKHATTFPGEKLSAGVSSSLPHDTSREVNASRVCNKDISDGVQDKLSSIATSQERQKVKSGDCDNSTSVATEKRQVCTVSATSVYPVVSSATVVSGPNSSSKVSSNSPASGSQNSTSLNPVVVVVPVSSNNICKVRPQQQQRSPTHDSVPVLSTGSASLHHHPQSSQTSTTATTAAVASVNTGTSESGTSATSLVPTDASCHDVDRDYVDLALSAVGSGGGGGNSTASLHDQSTYHSSWSTDGSASVATSNTTSVYYGKVAGSQQSVEPGSASRSFWPISEQQSQLADAAAAASQSCARAEVGGQFNVHPADHATMGGLFPTGVNELTGNKGSGLPSSALHSLYPVQVNFPGQSLPAPTMDSYSSTTAAAAAAYAGGTASAFNEFACKLPPPPPHIGSPTQQQHPSLGSSSVYITPSSLLHSSVSMGGGPSQQVHSTYPATTTNWTGHSVNHAHPSHQQALLHSRQQRVRHRPVPNSAVESAAPFSGLPYHPDAQNDYTFLQSGIPPAANSGLYSSMPAHAHSVYVPPTSRPWSLLGAPTAAAGASVMRNQDYHSGITGMTAPPSFSGPGNSLAAASGGGGGGGGTSAGGGAAASGGAVGLLPHPIPPVGGGRVSNEYAPYVGQASSVSSAANVGFSASSSLVNNYVGVIGCGRPAATAATAADLGRADQLALSLRHRGGGQQGFFQPLHPTGPDSSSTHSNQLAGPPQHQQQSFPVHSGFYPSSSHHHHQQQQHQHQHHQQQHRLQQQLSQFAVGGQSAVARAAVNSVAHHGLVGGPPAATGLYATFGTPPPNQPTPPPLPAHPGPAQLASTALRHGVEGWHWWA